MNDSDTSARLIIDAERCQGHGVCTIHAPVLVKISDDGGRAISLLDFIPAPELLRARRAVDNCPERAISIVGCDHPADESGHPSR